MKGQWHALAMGQDMTDLPPVQPDFEQEGGHDGDGGGGEEHGETSIGSISIKIVCEKPYSSTRLSSVLG